MATATLSQNVRELTVCGPRRGTGFPPAEADAAPLFPDDVAGFEFEDAVGFEDADWREHQACLPDPYPTATTRWGCEL